MDISPADEDDDGRVTVAEYAGWLQGRAGPAASPVPRYRGQTFDEWLTVLEIERDVETVIDAMKAVIALSKDDRSAEASTEFGKSERFRAAAAVLRAARRFGGMAAAGTNFGSTFGPREAAKTFRQPRRGCRTTRRLRIT